MCNVRKPIACVACTHCLCPYVEMEAQGDMHYSVLCLVPPASGHAIGTKCTCFTVTFVQNLFTSTLKLSVSQLPVSCAGRAQRAGKAGNAKGRQSAF